MSDDPVMFVRHGGKGFLDKRWAQDWLYGESADQPRIGIHYHDKASFDSSDYPSRGNRIDRMEEAAPIPTITVVSFSKYPKGEKYVTRTIPDSREVVVMDIDNKQVEYVEEVGEAGSVPEFTERYDNDGQYKVIKTLRVEAWKRVPQENHKLLWDWHSREAIHDPVTNAAEKTEYIRAVYQGNNKPLITTSLSSHDQELIAEKYLRDKLDDFTLDAPRGGTLENIDVLGTVKDEDNGNLKTVVASVTSSTGGRLKGRVEDINFYSDRDEVYFFDAEDSRPRNLHDDVTYVSLEDVFEWMNEEDTRRQRSLHTMLGLRDPV